MQSKSPPLSLTNIYFFGADIDYVPSNNTVIVKSVSILYLFIYFFYIYTKNEQTVYWSCIRKVEMIGLVLGKYWPVWQISASGQNKIKSGQRWRNLAFLAQDGQFKKQHCLANSAQL